ncbi:MAG: hypothetical protein Q4F53_09765 [Nesterenkonia sp.]|uniref:hypothetical protein n=1 Tax=Nesterenkonia marinintestina TaxID=2979865 RepID=UPI0021C20025|nr:hypothetical protein [Nesterenkonia sp. GX14115]MDO5493879.1 hypothetical protein [Nesterenkonia sp.]
MARILTLVLMGIVVLVAVAIAVAFVAVIWQLATRRGADDRRRHDEGDPDVPPWQR